MYRYYMIGGRVVEELENIDEQGLRRLVDRFYEQVRQDSELGPIFGDAVADWPEHLEKLTDFWSSVMLRTGRYKGNPLAAHILQRPRLSPALFERWLALWEETTAELMPPAAAVALQAKAARIAESLQIALFFKLPPVRDQKAA
jgi:hemoglobin